MYPTEAQIKELLTLPTPIAIDAASTFSQLIQSKIQQLSKKMLLLTEVMAQLDARLPPVNKTMTLVKKDGKA